MNDPSSAEGFTVIFNKARNEKKGGGVSDLPGKDEHAGYNKNDHVLGKPTVSDSISSLNSRKVKIVERITERVAHWFIGAIFCHGFAEKVVLLCTI